MPSFVFILGREPHLSVAEIAAVLPDAEWAKAELGAEALVVPVDVGEGFTPSRAGGSESRPYVRTLMDRLGGTIKIGVVWRTVGLKNGEQSGRDPDGMDEAIGRLLLEQANADRKVHFGFSVYDLGGERRRTEEVRRAVIGGAAAHKALLKEHGRTARWVMSREPTLSSVIVQKEKLLPDQNGIEVLVLVGASHVTLAQTLAVQPFEAWGRRDYGKPARSMARGMLPPKLARVMLNIGIGNSSLITRTSSLTILDPFCGTGTVLLEALALGCRVIGSDVDVEAIAESRANLEWLRRTHASPTPSRSPSPREGEKTMGDDVRVQQCDVRKLSECVAIHSVDAIVTEPYLGPTQGIRNRGADSRKTMAELHALYVAAFREFAKVLKSGGHTVFVVPVFRAGATERAIDITRDVERFGFRRVGPFPAALRDHPALHNKENLPYAREGQHVGRQILVFERT